MLDSGGKTERINVIFRSQGRDTRRPLDLPIADRITLRLRSSGPLEGRIREAIEQLEGLPKRVMIDTYRQLVLANYAEYDRKGGKNAEPGLSTAYPDQGTLPRFIRRSGSFSASGMLADNVVRHADVENSGYRVLGSLLLALIEARVMQEPKMEGTAPPLAAPPPSSGATSIESDQGPIEKVIERSIYLLQHVTQQIVLAGPPGTSKTYTAREIVKRLKVDDSQSEIVQFHPSYAYEDFVRGIQVKTVDGHVQYEVVRRILNEWADRAREKPAALIIDEINRANLAQVLGELIYGLEYREAPVRTPYKLAEDDDGRLMIPRQLYLIGTMNTADRSVGRLDYAVRRRFAFIHMPPQEEIIRQYYARKDVPLAERALGLFRQVDELFAREAFLAPELERDDMRIGHTYYLAEGEKELRYKFVYQVVPILREYFRDRVLIPRGKDVPVVEINGNKFPLDREPDIDTLFTALESLA